MFMLYYMFAASAILMESNTDIESIPFSGLFPERLIPREMATNLEVMLKKLGHETPVTWEAFGSIDETVWNEFIDCIP